MKKCPDCKTANLSHLYYCRKCGGKLYKDNLESIRKGAGTILDLLKRCS